MKTHYLILLLLILLLGCVSDFAFDDIPTTDPELVVFSLLSPNEPFSCYVSQTQSIADTSSAAIDNATVIISAQGHELCQLENQGDGYYSDSTHSPEQGVEYRLQVVHHDFGEASATATIPQAQTITDVLWVRYLYLNDTGGSYGKLQFTIPNSPSEPCYYDAVFFSTWLNNRDSARYYSPVINFGSYDCIDAVLLAEGLWETYPQTLLFSNNLFAGDSHTFNLYTGYGKNAVTLFTISEALYNYRRSSLLNEDSETFYSSFDVDQVIYGIYQPVSTEIYSNFDGAHGLFGAYNTYTLHEDIDSTEFILVD